jgi:phage gp36-like protein
MSYCTANDILTNLQMTSSDVPTALSTQAVAKADAVINAKLPAEIITAITALGSTPAVIKHIAEDIGAYYVIRALYSASDPNRNEWYELYKNALDLLDDMSEGKANIPGITADDHQILSNTEDYKPTFDTRDETKWRVDPDRIDDLDDEADN